MFEVSTQPNSSPISPASGCSTCCPLAPTSPYLPKHTPPRTTTPWPPTGALSSPTPHGNERESALPVHPAASATLIKASHGRLLVAQVRLPCRPPIVIAAVYAPNHQAKRRQFFAKVFE